MQKNILLIAALLFGLARANAQTEPAIPDSIPIEFNIKLKMMDGDSIVEQTITFELPARNEQPKIPKRLQRKVNKELKNYGFPEDAVKIFSPYERLILLAVILFGQDILEAAKEGLPAEKIEELEDKINT